MQNTAWSFVVLNREGMYGRTDNSHPRGKPEKLLRHVRLIGSQTVKMSLGKDTLSFLQCHSFASGKSYFVGSDLLGFILHS